MQLVSKIAGNQAVRRLAVAVTVAMLALTMLAVGRTMTSSPSERGFGAAGSGGSKVLAANVNPSVKKSNGGGGPTGKKPR